MMLKRLVFLGALLLPCITGAKSTSWLQSIEDCSGFFSLEATRICERLIRSREYLDEVHPKVIPNKKGNLAEAREVVLIAWDAFDLPHRIWVRMPLRPKLGENFQVTTLTNGYTVERIRGIGPYKLEFKVTKDGHELKVYGGKHVWIPNKYSKEWSYKTLSSVAEEKQYLPFLDHLYHPELVERGLQYLESMIDRARNDLATVPSLAFPGWVLRDSYPSEMVLNLIVSEQTDPFRLFDETTPASLPRSSYLLGVLVEMAMHGPGAYAGLCSKSNACGWTQFTNMPIPEKGYPGTYSDTYNKCRNFDGRAVIERNFLIGTGDPHNALKAAFCYLDMENAKLPYEARAEFLRDPKRGSIYMLVAYHSGPGLSKKVFNDMKNLRKQFAGNPWPFDHVSLPKSLFQSGKETNPHAHWYIKKYLWVWDLLFKDREVVVPATSK